MEPATLLTASGLATLAFTKAFEETIKTLTGEALKKVGSLLSLLRQKIKEKLSGNPEAAEAIAQGEASGSEAEANSIATHLQAVMTSDPSFAEELKEIATKIHNELNIAVFKKVRTQGRIREKRKRMGVAYSEDLRKCIIKAHEEG
ncbi:hypothetical protein, partial [Tumidithrix helvetica]|uniref:hypothetical protein n=1 Tax=Tumidithrix helvetica TaxID=3457545 RepID=UPI003CC55B50